MEIQDIKNRLTLSQVLHYYHLKPDKQLRLNCPFHDDKTPSLQVYYKTHTAYCFSSNCKTHGKSLDVIDFIMYKESCTKHEAIVKAKGMINGNSSGTKANSPTQIPMDELPKIAVLTKMFTYFKNGVHNSKPAKEYLEKRGLDFTKTEVGYNSGQFHHGKRKDKALIKSCIKYGILLDLGTKSRTGNPAYKPFGKWCICFALKNREGKITGLYFRSTLDDKKQRHFYLRDRQGLYPNYPSKDTKKLILTESIIDAASLEAQTGIKNKYTVLALYGTNGLTEEHQRAIKDLQDLEEIIFFLNGDAAGSKAVQKYAPMLKGEYPSVKISNVQVPENEDVNSLLQGHSPEILHHLIKTRKDYGVILGEVDVWETSKRHNRETGGQPFLFSVEESIEKEKETPEIPQEVKTVEPKKEVVQTGLDTNNPYNLKYTGLEANYQIKGFKINQLDSLKITLQIAAR